MTQEQKAKAYDEALKLMRDCVLDEDGLMHVHPSDIFRSLEESLDERIRKALLRFHASTIYLDGIKGKDILAWLEKQGQKPAWSEEDEEMYQNIHECLKNGWRKLPTDLLKYESWFESIKQRIR